MIGSMLNDHAGLVFVALFAGTRAAARLVPPASARDLAAIRILVGGILLGSTLIEDVASTAALPRGLVQPMGVLDALYALPIGFTALVESAPALGALRWATAALLLLATVGWHTRVVLPLAAGAYLVLGGI